ncbi:MAG: hypothetical protein II821_07325 [Treponema sp.]|nr:hypothetical protein [Treponema sp.]
MKKPLLSLVSLLSFSFLFAGFNDGKTTKFVQFDLTSTTYTGVERYNTLFSGEAGAVSHWWETSAGIQGYKNAFDFKAGGQVWFPFTNWEYDILRLSLGAGALYHFQKYSDVSFENDFLAFSTFRLWMDGGLTVSFFGGYSWKITKLSALDDCGIYPYVFDDYPTAGMTIDKVWENGLEFCFEHSLHDDYRFPLFCAPRYAFLLAVNLDSGIRYGAEYSFRVIDGYAASPYVDSRLIKLSARYSF